MTSALRSCYGIRSARRRQPEEVAMPAVTRRRALQAGLAAATATAAPRPSEAQGEVRVRLRILETTDLHVNVLPYDYYRDVADDTVGLSRTASLVAKARGETPNALLFDNGDLIQGSPLGDFVANRRGMKDGDVHPMVAAMNALRYDAGTIGNHEFNYGLDFLARSLAAAAFPVVCANVVRADGSPLARPWLILQKPVTDEAGATHALRVGVIGFVPPQIMQ
jgi:2',3'-cyclic-nucleotide 2'-phosphodiesterase / 3'-nucleotidase